MKVGVLMPIGPQDPTGVVPGWAAMREAALATEEAGLDSVWVYDHLLFRFGNDPTQGIHECWTILSGSWCWPCPSATRRWWPRWPRPSRR